MSINDLPVLSALRTKMQWHQERQRVLAENVSNSDTPNFKPRDLVQPKFDPKGVSAAGSMGSLAMMQTSTSHIAASGGGQSFAQDRKVAFEPRPGGNLALQPQPASSEDRDRQGLEHDPEKHALGLRPDGWEPVFPRDKREA